MAHSSKATILVVDDTPDNLQALVGLLKIHNSACFRTHPLEKRGGEKPPFLWKSKGGFPEESVGDEFKKVAHGVYYCFKK